MVRTELTHLDEPSALERFDAAIVARDNGHGHVAATRWFEEETERADVAAWDEQDRAEAAGEPLTEYDRLFGRARALSAAAELLGDDEERARYEAHHAGLARAQVERRPS